MKALIWLTYNGAILSMAWFSVNGNEPIGRIFGMVCWVALAFNALPCFVLSDKDVASMKLARSAPKELGYLVDFALIGFLQYNGWTTLAIVMLLTLIFQEALFHRKERGGKP